MNAVDSPESAGLQHARMSFLRDSLRQAIDRQDPRHQAIGKPNPDEILISPMCYPGLRSFRPDEGELFVGREESCREIQKRLENKRTLIVIGGSGAGKSSLVRAGLLPFLNSTRRIEGRKGRWFYAECRPGRDDPVSALWTCLDRVLDDKFEDKQGSAPALDSGMDRMPRADANADQLLRIVERLDNLDKLASRGRSGPANLLLLIDQFEEVFRSTVPPRLRQELLDLLVVCHTRIEEAARKADPKCPGLFLVLTMRSEELHRCTEHSPLPEQDGEAPISLVDDPEPARSLTDVVNNSNFLLRLLDMKEDREDLRRAALEPARKVLKDYSIPFDEVSEAPFAPGVIDWLLKGAGQIGAGAEHQADQMPLLQHALRQMWISALLDSLVDRPDNGAHGDTPPPPLTIEKRHLFLDPEVPDDSIASVYAQKAETSETADVRTCLEDKARRTEILARNEVKGKLGKDFGEAPIKAMCRALARRDDRGNWARRYAGIESIDEFLVLDQKLKSSKDKKDRRSAILVTVSLFVREGLLQYTPRTNLYDISHEALVRNWEKCQDWLRLLVDVGAALTGSVRGLGPNKPLEAAMRRGDDQPLRRLADYLKADGRSQPSANYRVPSRLADQLSPLTPKYQSVPTSWAADELVDLLSAPEQRSDWGLAPRSDDDDISTLQKDARIVLAGILEVRRRAESIRFWRSAAIATVTVLCIAGITATLFFGIREKLATEAARLAQAQAKVAQEKEVNAREAADLAKKAKETAESARSLSETSLAKERKALTAGLCSITPKVSYRSKKIMRLDFQKSRENFILRSVSSRAQKVGSGNFL